MSPGQLVCNVFKIERPNFDRYRRPRAMRVVVWGLGHSGRSRYWWAPGGGGVAVPAIEILPGNGASNSADYSSTRVTRCASAARADECERLAAFRSRQIPDDLGKIEL
jgi:hypothetical protein